MRPIASTVILLLCGLVAACAGGGPAADAAEGAAEPSPVETSAPATPAPPVPGAAPPAPPPTFDSSLAAHEGLRFDCSSDNECAVKNVGNCCGHYDACVRADSPTDPEAVLRECADLEIAGICGYPVIERCVCSAGRCQAAPSMGGPPGADR